MGRNFIADFEKKLLKFERELRELVLEFFSRKAEGTTYEIGYYLRHHSIEFTELKKYSQIKSWYRLRKTLEILEKEGVLRKEMRGGSINGLKFLNYRWIKIVNKL